MRDLLKQIPNLDRLRSDIDALASYTDPEQPWTRRPFTKLFQEGRRWLSREMEAAGLAVALDASGNVVGRRPGAKNLPPILIGSHTDTVSGGGRFDGSVFSPASQCWTPARGRVIWLSRFPGRRPKALT